jgi:uncharacterized protein (TIGR00369 family)
VLAGRESGPFVRFAPRPTPLQHWYEMTRRANSRKTPHGQHVRFRVALACALRSDVPSSISMRVERKLNMHNRTYATVSPELQKEMTGLEFVEGLVSGALPLNTIAQTLGYDVVEAESGRVVITLEPTGAHLNPWGTVHGGLTATLLDSCMGLAIQSTLEKGVGSTTLEFKISLVRAVTLETGQVRAEGRVLNCGRRVGMAEGRVTDTKGRLLAHGSTTCLIFPS